MLLQVIIISTQARLCRNMEVYTMICKDTTASYLEKKKKFLCGYARILLRDTLIRNQVKFSKDIQEKTARDLMINPNNTRIWRIQLQDTSISISLLGDWMILRIYQNQGLVYLDEYSSSCWSFTQGDTIMQLFVLLYLASPCVS